jgi:hypothetical protein
VPASGGVHAQWWDSSGTWGLGLVIEFSDGMHEYVTTPVKRVLRLAGREVFYIETVNSRYRLEVRGREVALDGAVGGSCLWGSRASDPRERYLMRSAAEGSRPAPRESRADALGRIRGEAGEASLVQAYGVTTGGAMVAGFGDGAPVNVHPEEKLRPWARRIA